MSKKQICTVGMVICIALLNIVDAILTVHVVGQGKAYEANPIMRSLLDLGPVPFLSVKIGFTPAILVCAYFLGMKQNSNIKWGYIIPILLTFALYIFLVVNGIVIMKLTQEI